MTYDELMAMYTGAGGGMNTVQATGEGGGYTGGDYRTVNVPGIGYVTVDQDGRLVSTNRYETGGAYGNGGARGIRIGPGETATPWQQETPAYDSAAATRRGLGLVASVIAGGYGLQEAGVGAGAGMSGLDAASLAAIDGVSPTQLAALTNPAGSGISAADAAAALGGVETASAGISAADAAAALGGVETAAETGGMFSNALANGSTAAGSAAGPLGGSTFGAPAATSTLGTGGGFLGPAAGGAAASGLSGLLSNPALIGAGVGALAGAAGSGDKTATTQNLMDPDARAYLNDFRARAGRVADQPYKAPDFSLTQGPTTEQGQGSTALRNAMDSPLTRQANNLFSGFMDGSRDGTAAGNAQLGTAQDMIGRGTQQGTAAQNAYAGPNSFLDPMIAAAQGDLSRSYANTVAPKFASGSSFGNSGLGFAEVDSRNDLMRNLGRVGTDLRFADYNLQANLGEQAAQRADNLFTNNQNRLLNGAQTLGNFGEQAAQRTDNMFTNNQDRAMQGATNAQAGVRDQADMASTLFNQGSTLWNQGQQNIDNQWAAYTNQQDYARNQLSAMNPGLGVGMDAGRSTTTPGNRYAGAVGGAVLGAQTGSMFNRPAGKAATLWG